LDLRVDGRAVGGAGVRFVSVSDGVGCAVLCGVRVSDSWGALVGPDELKTGAGLAVDWQAVSASQRLSMVKLGRRWAVMKMLRSIQKNAAGKSLRRRVSKGTCEVSYSGVQARFEEARLKMKPRTPIYKTEQVPEIS
jgi:hypothetical protein